MKRLLPKFNTARDTYNLFLESLKLHAPNLANPSDDYDMHRAWELNNRPNDFHEALYKNMISLNKDDGLYHASTVYKDQDGNYEFVKKKNHPTRHYELDWYYSPKGKEFRDKFEFVEETDSTPAKFVRRKK